MMEGEGSSTGTHAVSTSATGNTTEEQPKSVPEPECNVQAPSLSDREATELQSWPVERAPTRPESDAGFYAHLGHWIYGFSMNAKVPPNASRDHLANERTFLGWVRTSISLAITGTVIAQLFRLQQNSTPRPFSYYRLGIPLASICHGAALIMVLIGAHKFRMQQKAMIGGRIKAAGWEVWTVAGMVTIILIIVFVLLVAVDIEKEL